jgi:LmbE family N-acetylglucosaminyl deacetylase
VQGPRRRAGVTAARTADDHVPAVVLAVYAHPNDAEISCGGTLASWAAAGADVHLVVGTLGEKGSYDPATDPEVLARARADEVAEAAATLGLRGVEPLGYPDGELRNTVELRGRLVAAIRAHRPDTVVCPDPTAVFFGDGYVNHVDHRELGWATLDAVAPAAASPLYFPEAGPAHQVERVYLSGTLEPGAWVDIDGTLDVKVAALACHRSQLSEKGDWLRDFVRRRAEDTGREAGLRYAEAYRRLTLAR